MTGKQEELLHYLEKHDVHIAVIQETKFTTKSKIKATPNYTLVRKDRGNDIKGGGVAFLVHNSIRFQKVESPNSLKDDLHLEELTIKIISKNPVFIRNIYIPPASSCNTGYSPPVRNLTDGLGDTQLILGDFNAHHHLWHTEDTEDTRGRLIAEWIGESSLGILNENQPTRVTDNSSTAPDLTIASDNCLTTCSWAVDISLGSDHLPIHISMTTEIEKCHAPNKTFVNFKKADWASFTSQTEAAFSRTTTNSDVHQSEKTFRNIINKAAKQHIPAGRIPKTFNAMPTQTAKLVEERDKIRRENPADPRIQDLNHEINIKIKEHRQDKWLEHLEKCGPGTKQLWDTIKSVDKPPRQPDNQGIMFSKKHFNKPKNLANQFNAQYTPGSETKPTQGFRNLLRNMRKKTTDPEIVFTADQTRKAIKKAKNSKAMGPDHISPIMMKHIGENGINFLTNIFNCSVNQSIVPPIWKIGRIIPLLKQKKPEDEGTSYRPISLLSPRPRS